MQHQHICQMFVGESSTFYHYQDNKDTLTQEKKMTGQAITVIFYQYSYNKEDNLTFSMAIMKDLRFHISHEACMLPSVYLYFLSTSAFQISEANVSAL